MEQKKAKYGWYHINVMFFLGFLGIIGLGAIILSFLFEGVLSIILMLSGIIVILIFLWPAIGLLALNLYSGNLFVLESKIPVIEEFKAPKILDVGCGTGRISINLAKNLKNGATITGIDIYDEKAITGNSLETIQKNAKIEGVSDKTHFQYGSATNIPFEDNTFDIVNISFVMHEFSRNNSQDIAMREIYRVLKPNGYFLLGELTRSSWQMLLISGVFVLNYKKQQYWTQLLEKHGFKEISYDDNGGFGIFQAKK
ncbi:MAG: class I SAM-dependent methyltransferase [Candidatus Hermodarchaeota archaeon]